MKNETLDMIKRIQEEGIYTRDTQQKFMPSALYVVRKDDAEMICVDSNNIPYHNSLIKVMQAGKSFVLDSVPIILLSSHATEVYQKIAESISHQPNGHQHGYGVVDIVDVILLDVENNKIEAVKKSKENTPKQKTVFKQQQQPQYPFMSPPPGYPGSHPNPQFIMPHPYGNPNFFNPRQQVQRLDPYQEESLALTRKYFSVKETADAQQLVIEILKAKIDTLEKAFSAVNATMQKMSEVIAAIESATVNNSNNNKATTDLLASIVAQLKK